MANQWFRMYAEFLNDPKVQMLNEQYQRRLIMLYCMRCDEKIPTDNDDEVAWALRIGAVELSETKKSFIQKGFIDETWNIIKWDDRQYVSDSSALRVKKHREFKKKMGLTTNGYTKHNVTVTQRDEGKCIYCGGDKNLCIDHILPVCQGGNDDIENLGLSCKSCNSGKAGRTPAQAGYSFKNKLREFDWNKWVCDRVTVTVTPPDTDSDTETDTEVDRGDKSPPSTTRAVKSKSDDPIGFVEFYGNYPKTHCSRQQALKSFNSALTKGFSHETIIAGLAGYLKFLNAVPDCPTAHPTTWLNQERWTVDYDAAITERRRTSTARGGAAAAGWIGEAERIIAEDRESRRS